MARGLWTLVGVLVVLGLIAGPVAFALHQQAQMRNFRVVKEGVLYRSGQLSPAALKRVLHDLRIRTVICLREGNRPADMAEEVFLNKEEIKYVRIPPLHWEIGPNGRAEVDEGIQTFLEVMKDPHNYPVLIHCFAGIHRTGGYCAVFRMEHDHWDNARAINEMKACGYTNLDNEGDILGYLERYRPKKNAR